MLNLLYSMRFGFFSCVKNVMVNYAFQKFPLIVSVTLSFHQTLASDWPELPHGNRRVLYFHVKMKENEKSTYCYENSFEVTREISVAFMSFSIMRFLIDVGRKCCGSRLPDEHNSVVNFLYSSSFSGGVCTALSNICDGAFLRQWRHSGVFFVNVEHISHLVLVFL